MSLPPPLLLVLLACGPFVRLPGGPVVTGGHSESQHPGAAERRQVVAVEAFELASHPTTNAEFATFLNEGHANLYDPRSQLQRTDRGFAPGPGKGAHPVVYVNFYAAQAYARWAGGRLPLAVELEYAGRGRGSGESLAVPGRTGETVLEGTLYGGGQAPRAGEGAAPADPLGYARLPSLSGDVLKFPAGIWEWTQNTLPSGAESSAQRLVVVKGGGRMDPPANFEVWMNDIRPATLSASDLGFRIARSLRTADPAE